MSLTLKVRNFILASFSGRDGFLGCIRQILLNGTLREVDETLRSDCTNKCESHDCQHESRCEEDFERDVVRCVCTNAIVHSGHLCQNSRSYCLNSQMQFI